MVRPGVKRAAVAHLRAALGDELFERIDVESIHDDAATASPIDTPMWSTLAEIIDEAHPGAPIQPGLIVGGTDSRFFRDKGTVAYGAGLFSPSVTLEVFAKRFHGHDERVDVESLGLSTQLWLDIAERFWD